MKIPDIKNLPPPPHGKADWPWTVGSSPVPDVMPDGKPWPKVSIITPSFNQGWALEETLRSVLLQGYPNLEYIVMDDDSTDGSVDIIKKYEPWISYWQTAPNRGQTQVLNDGFSRASGEVFGWMNSDDIFLPNGIEKLVRLRANKPECVGWAGASREIDREGNIISEKRPRIRSPDDILHWVLDAEFYQPACLFSAKLFREVGCLDEFMWCGMDFDLWHRLRAKGEFAFTDELVASPRLYPAAKSWGMNMPTMVDLVAIFYKLGNRKSAERLFSMYEYVSMRTLTVPQAMKGFSTDEYLNYVSIGEIAGYLWRRLIRKVKFK